MKVYFNILLLFRCLCFVCSSHHVHFNETVYEELEALGDAYYFEQKDERYMMIADDFKRINPNYPCIYGTIPLGANTKEGIDDGHKFTCGIHFIKGEPIIYSFGSCKDQTFELSLLKYRPDAKIYIFEIDPDKIPDDRDPRITYYNVGLGGYPSEWFAPLPQVSILLRKEYIDSIPTLITIL